MALQGITINLSKAQALVLFEFLSRFIQEGTLDIVDQAEERVLSNLLGKLEKQLSEPFDPNYLDLLKEARSEIRDDVF